MKKLQLISIIILLAFSLQAQNPDTARYYYCELIVVPKPPLNIKLSIGVNFAGEEKFNSDTTYSRVLTKDGKMPSYYKTAVEALNFMGSKGWRVVIYYTSTIQSIPTPIEHYLLEKRE